MNNLITDIAIFITNHMLNVRKYGKIMKSGQLLLLQMREPFFLLILES